MSMRKAVIYCRVSTEDQKENGFSLNDQERRLISYCDSKSIEVLEIIKEDYSAKSFKRPEFQRFLDSVKRGFYNPDLIICVRPDRFSRNALESLNMVKLLKSLHVEVLFLEQNYDLSIPENLAMFMFSLAYPQIENERRALNTIRGQRQALREGRWMWKAPKGYVNNKRTKRVEVASDSGFILRAFQLVAGNLDSIDGIRKRLVNEGFECSKQQFLNLLKNRFYTGKIVIDAWKEEPEEIAEGLHEAIISDELFNQVQDVFAGKGRSHVIPSKLNEDFPLRGHLNCSKCGGTLTASSSKGRTQRYGYYHCQNCNKERYSSTKANEFFEAMLDSFKLDEDVSRLYMEVLNDVILKQNRGAVECLLRSKKELNKRERQLKDLDEQYLKGALDVNDFNRLAKQIKQDISRLREDVIKAQKPQEDLIGQFQSSLDFLKSIGYYFKNSGIREKKLIVGSIFPEKLKFENGKYRTESVNTLIELFDCKSTSYLEIENKKATISSGFSNLAPPLGLEPRTL